MHMQHSGTSSCLINKVTWLLCHQNKNEWGLLTQ